LLVLSIPPWEYYDSRRFEVFKKNIEIMILWDVTQWILIDQRFGGTMPLLFKEEVLFVP
jgi:hypothetical protein